MKIANHYCHAGRAHQSINKAGNGGPWSNAVYRNKYYTDPYRYLRSRDGYIGCYVDNGTRQFRWGPKRYRYSPASCSNACKHYKYVALQNNGWCSCDNTYKRSMRRRYNSNHSGGVRYVGRVPMGTKIPDSRCNKGGAGQGDGWTNAVYRNKKYKKRPASPFRNNALVAFKGGRHRNTKWCADEYNRWRCNRNGLGQWERFLVVTVRRRGQFALKGGKNHYRKFCADEQNTIRCNRNGIGQWERFTARKIGNKWALRSGRSGWRKYCADEGNQVKCNRNAAHQWERFHVHVIRHGNEELGATQGKAKPVVKAKPAAKAKPVVKAKPAAKAKPVVTIVPTAQVPQPKTPVVKTQGKAQDMVELSGRRLLSEEEDNDELEEAEDEAEDAAPKPKATYKFRRRVKHGKFGVPKASTVKVTIPWNLGSRRRYRTQRRRRYRVKPGTPAPTPGYQPMNSQCQGPFTAGGYAMGGHGIGSVYLSQPSLVARTAKPTPMPTYKGQTRAPTTKPTKRPTRPPTPPLVYVGCFKDMAKRNLKMRPPKNMPKRGYTPKSCQNACPKEAKFFGLQNGGECFCDKTWAEVKTPRNAINCKGLPCSIEGQLCPQGTPGAKSGNFCCYGKKWTKVKSPSCKVKNVSPYQKVKDDECNGQGVGLGGPMRNAIYEFAKKNAKKGGWVYEHPKEMPCKRGGKWTRPFGDVANNENGFKDCAKKCKAKGFTYFGLECPRHTVHCQCSNDLTGSKKMPKSQCDRKNVRHNTHCKGPYRAGHYLLGSHGTGSVYLTTPRLHKVTPPPTPSPTPPTPKPTTLPINHLIPGSTIALKSAATNKYCADEHNQVKCNRGWIRGWEKFVVYNENARHTHKNRRRALNKNYKHKFSGRKTFVALRGGKDKLFCADEPRTYHCGWEGQNCNCRGTVKYGQNNRRRARWASKTSTGNIGCNNRVFGDPMRGTRKKCMCYSANPVRCNRPHVAGWERFEVVNAGGGYVALRGGRGRMYCTAHNGGMRCDHPTNMPLTGSQKYKVTCVSDGIKKCSQRL